MATERRWMVRRVREAFPDGTAAGSKMEMIEVGIEWPDGQPRQLGTYELANEWVLVARQGEVPEP